MQVTLIHNPDAGADEQPRGDDLVRLIRGAGHTVIYQSSRAENWHTALENPCDIVAVAGGDGMVGKVAKRLIDRHVPIAVLPMGTANNIAKTLGLSDRPLEQLIAGWSAAPRVNFDVGVASGPWNSKCKGQQLQIEWDGSTVHIDDEVWPDKGSEFPLSSGVIDVTVKRGALEFLGAG